MICPQHGLSLLIAPTIQHLGEVKLVIMSATLQAGHRVLSCGGFQTMHSLDPKKPPTGRTRGPWTHHSSIAPLEGRGWVQVPLKFLIHVGQISLNDDVFFLNLLWSKLF